MLFFVLLFVQSPSKHQFLVFYHAGVSWLTETEWRSALMSAVTDVITWAVSWKDATWDLPVLSTRVFDFHSFSFYEHGAMNVTSSIFRQQT